MTIPWIWIGKLVVSIRNRWHFQTIRMIYVYVIIIIISLYDWGELLSPTALSWL